MKRSRIKIRLLFCLIGHVSLLLILAFYLQFSLRSVTKFTTIAHQREAELYNVEFIRFLLRGAADDVHGYKLTHDPIFLTSLSQKAAQIHNELLDSTGPGVSLAIEERTKLIQEWFTEVSLPVQNQSAAVDWDKIFAASDELLSEIDKVSNQQRAIVQSYIQGMGNEEDGVIEERVHLMWWLVGAVTFFTIIIQLMISNSIIDPLQHLEDVVKRIQGGDHTIRAQLQTNDEIQTLAEAFNEMARNLLANRKELESTNEQLEHRVLEKTAELEDKNTSLEQAARLKDEFLATISHELRTPLTPIMTCSYLLKNQPNLAAEDQEQISVIERNAKALSRMIDELLDLSASLNRKLTLHREWTDLVQWVSDTLRTLEATLESKRIRLEAELPQETIHVNVDVFRITQVLTNLVNNAVKFSDFGGTIHLRIGTEEEVYFVEVRDEGAGFEQDDIERIFEMFQQSRNTRTAKIGGLGVGLTVARTLAELHGGRLTAFSSGPGTGATFTLWLPKPAPETEYFRPKTVQSLRLIKSPLAGQNLLIVEDTPDTLASLKKIFERRGCSVYGAHSAEEAIAFCQSLPDIDIILSDIGLPGITGTEFMGTIRQIPKYQNIVALAISGLGRERDITSSLASGFDAHLLKPIDVQALEEKIEELKNAKFAK